MLLVPCVITSIDDESDRAYMENLYRANHRLMYWMAHKVMGARCDLDDVVADACVSLIRKIHVIRGMEGNILRAYIISTVRNTALTYLRAENRRYARQRDTDMNDLDSQEPDPLERACTQDRIERLMNAITRLPMREQDVLRMRYLSEMTDAEIAEIMGIERVTVRVALSRARKRAYQIMMEMEENGAR